MAATGLICFWLTVINQTIKQNKTLIINELNISAPALGAKFYYWAT